MSWGCTRALQRAERNAREAVGARNGLTDGLESEEQRAATGW